MQFTKSLCHTHTVGILKMISQGKNRKNHSFSYSMGGKNVSLYRSFESFKFKNEIILFESPHGCQIISIAQW